MVSYHVERPGEVEHIEVLCRVDLDTHSDNSRVSGTGAKRPIAVRIGDAVHVLNGTATLGPGDRAAIMDHFGARAGQMT